MEELFGVNIGENLNAYFLHCFAFSHFTPPWPPATCLYRTALLLYTLPFFCKVMARKFRVIGPSLKSQICHLMNIHIFTCKGRKAALLFDHVFIYKMGIMSSASECHRTG